MVVTHDLVRRLEASAAASELATVEAMLRRDPGCSATAEPFGYGALIAMGACRYVNRAIGVTVDIIAPSGLDTIEAFFADHGLPSAIELSPFAPSETVNLLRSRCYVPDWFRSVFAIALAGHQPGPGSTLHIERVDESTRAEWLEVLARGNNIDDDVRRATSDEFAMANANVPGTVDLLARIDTRAVGCASLHVDNDIGWLGGAATLPDWRGRGIQSALLEYRLSLASEAGLDLAAVTAVPSGASARNIGRSGFTHVQTQLVVTTDDAT